MLNVYLNEQGERLRVILEGRIEPHPGVELENLFQSIPQNYSEVTLDCAGLETISAAGLRMLTQLDADMKNNGGILILKNINQAIIQTMEIKGLISGFHIL